jgi:hypothetical protein
MTLIQPIEPLSWSDYSPSNGFSINHNAISRYERLAKQESRRD